MRHHVTVTPMQEEEIGLRGAFALDASLLTGRTMLNLDTEEAGQVYIGCAGCFFPLMCGCVSSAAVNDWILYQTGVGRLSSALALHAAQEAGTRSCCCRWSTAVSPVEVSSCVLASAG